MSNYICEQRRCQPDLEKLKAAAREAEKLWKLYQIWLQILRDRVK